METGESGRLNRDPQPYRGERSRIEQQREGTNRQTGRRNSARETGWERVEWDGYSRRHKAEAIVIHKSD